MKIKTIVKTILESDIIDLEAQAYNHNGQPIEHIIISEDNGIMLLTDKQYKRLLKEKKREV